MRHIDAWERVNARVLLAPLQWTLAHGRGIERFRAMVVGVSISGTRYLNDGRQPEPPIRTIVESGVHASFGSDSPSNPPLNPWLHVYAMVTGKNFQGRAIEPDQTLSRLQALRLYTIDGAWFTHDEDRLGSLEIGQLGDVVVLSDDVLDAARVPDDAIKHVRSVLTIVGGRIVHDEQLLRIRKQTTGSAP